MHDDGSTTVIGHTTYDGLTKTDEKGEKKIATTNLGMFNISDNVADYKNGAMLGADGKLIDDRIVDLGGSIEGTKVVKIGAKTGLTKGVIVNLNGTAIYDFRGKTVREMTLLVKSSDEKKPFSEAGDEGALVYLDPESNPRRGGGLQALAFISSAGKFEDAQQPVKIKGLVTYLTPSMYWLERIREFSLPD